MDFLHPERFRFLIPLGLLALWAVFGERRRSRRWEALGQSGRPPGDGAIGGFAAGILLIVALAQPRWGIDRSLQVPAGRDVVLLIDVSRSMGAEDAVPNRLGLAIEGAEGLLNAMGAEPGDRAAIVAFAGTGAVRCGLTENLGAAIDVVRSLRPGAVQPGGTDLRAALETAAAAFDDRDHADGRMIVLFTDGEDLAGGWSEQVDALKAAGIIVFAIGIGDPDSAHPVPSGNGSTVLSYEGKPVFSRRTDEPLRTLAGATGGVFIPVGLASIDLRSVYRDKIAPIAGKVRESTVRPDRVDRHGLFLPASLLALILGTRAGSLRIRIDRRPLIAVAASVGFGLFLGAGPPRDWIERGRAAYAAKAYREALVAFETAIRIAPDEAIPRFDAGAALFAMGRYSEAGVRYREARSRSSGLLRAKTDYAIANSYLMSGDLLQSIRHYDACIAASSAESTLRRDAEANRAYAIRLNERAAAPAPEPEESEPSPRPSPSSKPADPDRGPTETAPNPDGTSRGASPAVTDDDPETQLNSALERVRAALKNRTAGPLPSRPATGFKDW